MRKVNGEHYNAPDSDPRHLTFRRTSDQMPCDECGSPLWRHKQPLKEVCPTMVEDCLGAWWKT